MTTGMLTFEVDTKGLDKLKLFHKEWLPDTLEMINIRLTELFIKQLAKMTNEIPRDIPRGAFGLLRRSYVQSHPTGKGLDVQGIFGSASTYAAYVEEGTKPHWAPIEPLIMWVKRVLDLKDEIASSTSAIQFGAIFSGGQTAAGAFKGSYIKKLAREDAAFQVARRVQYKIAHHGTAAQPVVGEWFEQHEDEIFVDLKNGIEEITEAAILKEATA